jgi:hypothetical protein
MKMLPDQIRKIARSNTHLVNKNKKKLTLSDLMILQREKLIKETEFIQTITPQLNIFAILMVGVGMGFLYLSRKKYSTNYMELFYSYILDLEKTE